MKAILTCILLTVLLSVEINFAYAQQLEWGHGMGSSSADLGVDLAVDDSGNVYAIGMFNNSFDCDPGPAAHNLVSQGAFDIYVLKLDSSGNFVWAVTLGDNQQDAVYSIVYDDGNIVITGTYDGTIDFDPGPAVSSHSSNNSDIFILVLNSSGEFQWVNTFGNTGNDYGYSVTIDNFHNIYVSGIYYNSIDFDPGPGTYFLTANGTSYNAFLCKYTANGDLIWGRSSGGPGECLIWKLEYDSSGFIYSAGHFNNIADFDTGPGIFNLSSAGLEDVFISKHDSSGNFLWAKSYGGTNNDRGTKMAVDAAGDIILMGYFQNSINLDPLPGAGFNLSSQGTYDIFLLKLNPGGMFIRGGHISGPGIQYSQSLTIDMNNNLILAGKFGGTTDFDPDTATALYQTVTGSTNFFILQLDTLFNPLWVRSVGGTSAEDVKSLKVDLSGHIYLTGSYENGTIDLDPGPGNLIFTTSTLRDLFIVKYGTCPLNGSTLNLSSCDSLVSPSGNFTWTVSGTYYDILPDMHGCDSLLTISLSITSLNDSVSQNGNILISADNSASWQWVDCNNNFTAIPGETNQVFSASSTGSYAVILTSSGCSDTSACHQVNFTGLINNIIDSKFNILPNPANDKFLISFPQNEKIITVTIFNVSGDLVFKKVFNDERNILIHTSEFPHGNYFVKVEGEAFDDVKRLIITGSHE